jgi:hypothetical protein
MLPHMKTLKMKEEDREMYASGGGRLDYDNIFKTVLHRYFWEALRFFLPSLYQAANRSVSPEFLEQEMQKVTFDLGEGANRADLLARIQLADGKKELLLCHLEIQGEGGGDLVTRMYRYKQMIFLKHGEEPVGVAVLTAPRPRGEKSPYTWERFGTKVAYSYTSVSVVELEDEALLEEGSCVGLILYAAKCAWRSGDDEGEKFRYLRLISALWADRGWDRDDKRVTLLAVDYLMKLRDEAYVKEMLAHMKTLKMKEEDREMYVSMFERGYKEEGRMEGRTEGLMDVARNMLNKGFSMADVLECTNLPREKLDTLLGEKTPAL